MLGMAPGVEYPCRIGSRTGRSVAFINENNCIKSLNRNVAAGRVLCQKNAQAWSDSQDIFGSLSDVPGTVIDVHVGEHTMPVFTVDCDHVMETYIKAGMDDRDPYWTCIWPSSQALAAAVLGQGGDLVRGKRVADFGAGLGLAGVAAALSGADEVVFLDREPLALDCCLVNACLHGCLPSSSDACIVPRSVLEQETLDRKIESKLDAELFDWNDDVRGSHLHGFDVILVCDCLYEKFSVEPIARVLPLLLKEKGGAILLADPPNRAKANRDKFLGLMACSGLKISEERMMTTLENHQGGTREVQIVFMILSR